MLSHPKPLRHEYKTNKKSTHKQQKRKIDRQLQIQFFHKKTILFFSLLCLLSLQACQSQADKQAETAAELPLPPNKLLTPPETLAPLFNPPTAVLRGFDWNSKPEQIQDQESASRIEENSLGSEIFSLDLNEEEFADITYQFAEGQLTAIQLDIYPASEASANNYVSELTDFFNAKYKKRSTLWEGSEKEQIFTIFLTQKNSDSGPFVTVMWEKEKE